MSLNQIACDEQITEESTDDGEMLLVFRKDGEIIHVEMHFRFNGDFAPLDYPVPVMPEKATFAVVQDGRAASGSPWLRLRPLVVSAPR